MRKTTKKKFLVIVCTLITAVLATVVFSGAGTAEYVHKTILPDAHIYETPNFDSKVLATLPKGIEVEPTGDSFYEGSVLWQKVVYLTVEGYLPASDLYTTKEKTAYTTERAKVKSSKMGEKIALYRLHDKDSEVLLEIVDATQILVVKSSLDYGEFTMVQYKGGIYFVLDQSITTGLSYNQTLAVILSSAVIAALIGVLTFLYIRRKKRA